MQNDLRKLWQCQEEEKMKLSIDELQRAAARFRRRITVRNSMEYVAAVLALAALAFIFLKLPFAVPRICCALMAAGMLVVVIQLRRAGGASDLPGELGRSGWMTFRRRELERQRDLLRSVWKWYLGPLLPGVLLFLVWGFAISPPSKGWVMVLVASFVGAVFGGIHALNRRAAAELDRQVRELNDLEGSET